MCGSHSIPAPGPAQLHMGTMPRLAVLLLLLLSTASAHRPPVARVDDALTAAIAALQSAVDAAGAAGFVGLTYTEPRMYGVRVGYRFGQ